jgi:hypothetical protein
MAAKTCSRTNLPLLPFSVLAWASIKAIDTLVPHINIPPHSLPEHKAHAIGTTWQSPRQQQQQQQQQQQETTPRAAAAAAAAAAAPPPPLPPSTKSLTAASTLAPFPSTPPFTPCFGRGCKTTRCGNHRGMCTSRRKERREGGARLCISPLRWQGEERE